ncbi:MAG: helix-turn-helix domain-containing protein [Planctomycetota bacterium]
MKLSFEKLEPHAGQSFRCIDRSELETPVKWHRHPEIELTYVQQGTGSRIVGDHIGAYGDHDLVLLGSNLPHTWTSDEYRGRRYDRHKAIVVQFHPDFLGEYFFEIHEMQPIQELLCSAYRGLWASAEEASSIGEQMTEMLSLAGPSRLISLLSILAQLTHIQTKTLASAGYSGPTSKDAESRIQQVCDHIENSFTSSSFSISSLAEMLFMNQSAFSRFFKQSTGRTPTEYLNELRIGYACRQLIESDHSILDICHASGFDSPSFFNRTFKRLRSSTPRGYRALHGKLRKE